MGEAYPGSTGGEIFNYYGTDTLKNTASGDYSTTIGINNKNGGKQSFVGGSGNSMEKTHATGYVDNNLVFGLNNYMNDCRSSIIIGNANQLKNEHTSTKRGDNIIIGSHNINNLNNNPFTGQILIGNYLQNAARIGNLMILGEYNAYPTLNTACFVVGSGISSSNRKNSIEVSIEGPVMLHSLIFPSNTTYKANAITAPLSNPASADDQTLATKAYVDGHTLGITVPRADVLLTGQSTSLAVGQDVNLTTDLSLTIPSWTKQIRLGIHNSGGYVEYLLVDNINAHDYVSVTGAGTIDVYNYNPATTTFSFVSGGASMSIVSVRAEGTASI